jgi:hypothetical protein
LSNLDFPLSGDTTASPTPFRAGVVLCTKLGSHGINEPPGKRCIGHVATIGQIVPSCQDGVSQDVWTARRYARCVATNNEELKFNDALCARVHRLREQRGWTAAQMATALGVPAERYRKYEYRSPLPHYLIERFALIVGRDVEYVLTGNRVARSLPMEERRKIA